LREQKADDVRDVNEIPQLLAVPIDPQRPSAGKEIREDRDYAGIIGPGVGARTVDIEETQPDRRNAVHDAGEARMQLASELIRRIGAHRRGPLVLGERHRAIVAVDLSRRGKNHRHPGASLSCLAHGVEQRDEAGKIDWCVPIQS
jgi:hypothetical protein